MKLNKWFWRDKLSKKMREGLTWRWEELQKKRLWKNWRWQRNTTFNLSSKRQTRISQYTKNQTCQMLKTMMMMKWKRKTTQRTLKMIPVNNTKKMTNRRIITKILLQVHHYSKKTLTKMISKRKIKQMRILHKAKMLRKKQALQIRL